MKALVRGAVFRAMLGASLGMLAGALLCQGMGLSPLEAMLTDGAYGALAMGSTILYDVEPWSLARSTVCHLLIALAGFCALGLAQNWLGRVPLWMLPAFLAAYFAVWLVQWMTCYHRVCRMNAALRQRRYRGEL